MKTISNPTVEVQMMIRKPVDEVFNAFVDPAVTSNFWFTKSSGPLAEGRSVRWEWEMYGAAADVEVIRIEKNRLISTRWGESATAVDYMFTDLGNDRTYVVIRNYGFNVEGEELISAIKDNTGGFTTVLDGLKAWLEHGLRLNLVADKFPLKK